MSQEVNHLKWGIIAFIALVLAVSIILTPLPISGEFAGASQETGLDPTNNFFITVAVAVIMLVVVIARGWNPQVKF